MNIERIDGDTKTVYHFHAHLDPHNRLIVRPDGASIQKRATPRSQWRAATSIHWEGRGNYAGYYAYDSHGRNGTPVNHRWVDLLIPEDVKREALEAFSIVWEEPQGTARLGPTY